MATVKTDNAAAVEFLRQWAPDGPWVLTAIQIDKKSIATKTFYPSGKDDLEKWLIEYNGKRNLYFHVNPPTRDLSKKANREDVKSVDWLHVDIDPRAGENLDEERVRALGLLQERLPKGVPAPTCVIFSGGGYQGFWKLKEPIPIDGDLALAEDAKLYNMQLELLFGADNCHNIDRIMRLPGTVNLPDARKKKKGREPALAFVVEFSDKSYPIEQFTKALIGGTTDVQVSGDVERVTDVSELDPWDVPDRIKIIMAQGKHPDQPKKGDDSRSAWLFDFCCQMVRCGVPDETIYAIITDPEWPISESVVEHKSGSRKYALKQIGSAKEWVIEPALVYMNGRHCVIKIMGGKCLVVTKMYDYALGRFRLVAQAFSELEKAHKNKKVQVGEDANGSPKYRQRGAWWLEHENRREYETIVFAPEKQVPDDIYNMWEGFAVDSVPGDCSLFMDHVLENVCGGNEEYFNYLMGWMARAVQQPAKPGEVAVVLRGGKGVGKSFFAKMFGSLFGQHFMSVSNSSHLVGNFNNHLRDLVVLFADEAFYAGDKKHESILKTLVTEDMIAIEAKGIDVENSPNYIHLIMAANDAHVIPASGDERRFFVLDVGTGRKQDTTYFRAVTEQLDNGGKEALLHTLMNYDLEGFNVRRVPLTDALREQKLLSLDVESEWWYQKLMSGTLLEGDDEWHTEIRSDLLTTDYVDYTRRFNIMRRGNETALGKFLQRVCPTIKNVRRRAVIEEPTADGWSRKVTRRCRFYIMPTLEQARAKWEEFHGRENWEFYDQETLPIEPGAGQDPPF